VVLLEGGPDRLVLAELLEDLGVVPAEGLEQDGDRLLALAVDADADLVRACRSRTRARHPGTG
jgi:hypothetical protein